MPRHAKDINTAAFAQRLRFLMEEDTMGKTEFTEKVFGKTKDAYKNDRINKYLNGKGLPSEPTLVKICKLFNVHRSYFVGEDQKEIDIENDQSVTVSIENVNLVNMPISLLVDLIPFIRGTSHV